MICSCCEKKIQGSYSTINKKHLCENCFNKKYFYCTLCKKIEKIENIFKFELHKLCKSCANKHFWYCQECKEYHMKSSVKCYVVNDVSFCEKHAEKYNLNFCYHCNALISDNDSVIIDGVFICKDCVSMRYFWCEGCKKYHGTSFCEYHMYDGKQYCNESLKIIGMFFCHVCRGIEKIENQFVYININENNKKIYCKRCKERHFEFCDYCNDYHLKNHFFPYKDKQLCINYLKNNNLFLCNYCGIVVSGEDSIVHNDEKFCRKCFIYLFDNDQLRIDKILKDYSYKPEPDFKGCSKNYAKQGIIRVFGFESEMYGSFETAKYISENFNEFVYLKSDSSIKKIEKDSGGFEVVSHPMTLEFLKTNSRMTELFSLFEEKCNADDKTGIHIHINKNSLKNDMMIKLLYFFHNNFLEKTLIDIAGRDFVNNDYCNKYNNYELPQIKNILECNPYSSCGNFNKHRVINFYSKNTIEFRMFAGNTKKHSIINACEFIEKTINFLKDIKFEETIESNKQIAEKFECYLKA